MSNANNVPDNLPGWLIAAGRAACGYGYRELCEAAAISTNWLQRIERLPVIALRHERGRGAEGIEPDSMRRLLDVFSRHGLELRGAAGGHQAMLICVDPAALEAVRAKNGKSADAIER